MGKTNRAKYAADPKQKRNKVIAILATVLALVLLGSLLVYNSLYTSGFFMRQTVAASSENFEINNAQASYFFHGYYQQFLAQFGSNISYLGLDTSKSLKAQPCSMTTSGNGTWFDYFLEVAGDTMLRTLIFCEEAKLNGIELDDTDYETIDQAVASLSDAAKAYGVSKSYYIHATYGAGVKDKDIRGALELSALSNKAYTALVDTYSFSADDRNAYMQEHLDSFQTIDYITMSLSTSDATVDGDITADMITDFVSKFAAAKNEGEFKDIAFDYLRNYAYKDNANTTDEDINDEIDGFLMENIVKDANSEFSAWAFDSARKANDTYTDQNEDGTVQYVYMLLSPASIDETATVNVRHALITTEEYESAEAAKAKAEELLAAWQAGPATAETFAAMANENSADSDGTDGGLYENVKPGDMVANFNDWIFADGRKAGDTGIVESEYGYHIMYLDSFGMKAWEADADAALKSEKFDTDYSALKEKHATNFDIAALYELEA